MDAEYIRISFTGDVSFTGNFSTACDQGNSILSGNVKKYLQSFDYGVCNLEGAVTDIAHPDRTVQDTHNPIGSVETLVGWGISVFNLANNHIMDYGAEILNNTLLELEKSKAAYLGAGADLDKASEPVVVEKNGIRVALFALAMPDGQLAGKCQPGIFSEKKINLLHTKIKAISQQVNHIVVMYHGGEEYTRYPSPAKRKLLRKIAAIPEVSIVIAHHSHTLQGVEYMHGKPILYSLGNFIFDIESHRYYGFTTIGGIAGVTFGAQDIAVELNVVELNTQRAEVDFLYNYPVEQLNDFAHYTQQWQADAWRCLHTRQTPESTEEEPELLRMSKWKLFFTPKLYKRLWVLWRTPNLRTVYIAAYMHRIQTIIHKKR